MMLVVYNPGDTAKKERVEVELYYSGWRDRGDGRWRGVKKRMEVDGRGRARVEVEVPGRGRAWYVFRR